MEGDDKLHHPALAALCTARHPDPRESKRRGEKEEEDDEEEDVQEEDAIWRRSMGEVKVQRVARSNW